MKLHIFTKYTRHGASSRYRTYQYLPALAQNGIEPQLSPLFDDAYLSHKYSAEKGSLKDVVWALCRRIWAVLKVPKRSAVVIEYELFPYCPALLEGWLLWRGCRILLDYDDAIFHKYDQHSNPWIRRVLGGKISALMRRADIVVVGNDYLAQYAKRAGAKRVEIIPTVVDLRRYATKTYGHSGQPYTIGWLGSPSTAQYLELIAPALAQVCRLTGARIRLVGSGPIDLSEVSAELIPWTESAEIDSICSFDVGVMPLPDDPWARGKCGFKLIQYMACGLPVVASPVGVNTEIISEGQQGHLASSQDEWIAALQRLASDHGARLRMGSAGRRRVEERYCLQVTAPYWISIVKSLGL